MQQEMNKAGRMSLGLSTSDPPRMCGSGCFRAAGLPPSRLQVGTRVPKKPGAAISHRVRCSSLRSRRGASLFRPHASSHWPSGSGHSPIRLAIGSKRCAKPRNHREIAGNSANRVSDLVVGGKTGMTEARDNLGAHPAARPGQQRPSRTALAHLTPHQHLIGPAL